VRCTKNPPNLERFVRELTQILDGDENAPVIVVVPGVLPVKVEVLPKKENSPLTLRTAPWVPALTRLPVAGSTR
jgi:hypothetical protein